MHHFPSQYNQEFDSLLSFMALRGNDASFVSRTMKDSASVGPQPQTQSSSL